MKKFLMVAMVVAIVGFAATWGFATALTEARDTPQRTGYAVVLGVASNETLWVGAMVAMNSGGYAVPASDATALKVIGRANATVVGGTTDGATSATVARGIFRWVNGDTFTTADVGSLAFVEDDQTVQKAAAATYDIIAGVIVDVDSEGVWVDTYNIGAQGASAPTTLAVTGNATVGGTLGVTGNATFSGTSAVTGNATVGGTFAAAGATRLPVLSTVVEATTNRVCTSADYGKVIVVSTNAAVTITLPANGAAVGSWVDVVVAGTDDCAPTIAAATADTLRGPNDVDLDSVTWGTGHRIGAYARFISDGSFWTVLNIGGTTMTYTD